MNFDPACRPRRQDLERKLQTSFFNFTQPLFTHSFTGDYIETGHFYFATIDLILNHGLLQSRENGAVVEMPPETCIELDYPYQWRIAELMAKQLLNN